MNGTLALFLGLTCDHVKHDAEAEQWCFVFQSGVVLQVNWTWRVITKGAIAVARDDDAQRFGLPVAIDAAAAACELLVGGRVSGCWIAPETSDIRIEFETGVRLEVFNNSSGYEAWQLNSSEGLLMVCQGGGRLVTYPHPPM